MSKHRAILEKHSSQQRLEEDHGGHTVKHGPTAWLGQQLEHADVDLVCQMVVDLTNGLMSADVDAVCGADCGVVSDRRVNRRNGYRTRNWDTRAGTVELAIPKLWAGSYFLG